MSFQPQYLISDDAPSQQLSFTCVVSRNGMTTPRSHTRTSMLGINQCSVLPQASSSGMQHSHMAGQAGT